MQQQQLTQPMPVTKKLINTAENCVEDNLVGFVKSHTGLVFLRSHRIVVAENVKKLCKKGQVTILSGGGSGHEPFAAGYVGNGMLTAAVAGSIFASPPSSAVFAAIRILVTGNSGGTLVLVANYTGDRLTFGQAVERAKAEGLKVEMMLVADDCALSNPNKAVGRRGLCGMVLVQKIAGAMARDGKSLEEIVEAISTAATKMGTIGICLSPCSLPGSGPMFTIPLDEIELGLGIHGEAGIKRIKFRGAGANGVVEKMIAHMTDPESASHLPLTKGSHVALVINNLGGLSQLEMNIVAKEVLEYLLSLEVRVERCYLGTFQTSLEMAGVTLTVLWVDEFLLGCLDAKCDAPAWQQAGNGHIVSESKLNKEMFADVLDVASEVGSLDHTAAVFNADDAVLFARVIQNCCTAIEEQEQKLNGLDSGCGDGDCGSTLKAGAQAIRLELDAGMDTTCPKDVLLQLGMIVAEQMGGCSGGLYSIFFTSAAQSVTRGLSIKDWCAALDVGIKAVMHYGGAEPGDRTMVDALHSAHAMLTAQIQVNSRPMAALTEAVAAAKEAATNTASMKAKVGRASYVSLEHLGQPDAGATAVAILMQAILDTLIVSSRSDA